MSDRNRILCEFRNKTKSIMGDSLKQMILYGSYARGDYEKDSDIDIVAIVHGNRFELQNKLKEIWDISADLEVEYGTIVSPTVIPYEEFEKYKNDLPYYRNILKEGVKVVA